jgi:hypothetical protein
MLPIVLFVHLVLFPNIPWIQVDRFETESDCREAAKKLDESTPLTLQLTCSVRT